MTVHFLGLCALPRVLSAQLHLMHSKKSMLAIHYPADGDALLASVLRLLHNLAFDEELRLQMVHCGMIPKVRGAAWQWQAVVLSGCLKGREGERCAGAGLLHLFPAAGPLANYPPYLPPL